MKRSSRLAAVASLLALTFISCETPTETSLAPIQAELTAVFDDRATFLAQFPDLPVEDFEEGRVADRNAVGCPGPLDATSDNDCFHPGEIEPGVRFNSELPAGGFEIALIGPGFSGAVTKTIVAGDFTDAFIVEFTGGKAAPAGGGPPPPLRPRDSHIDRLPAKTPPRPPPAPRPHRGPVLG